MLMNGASIHVLLVLLGPTPSWPMRETQEIQTEVDALVSVESAHADTDLQITALEKEREVHEHGDPTVAAELPFCVGFLQGENWNGCGKGWTCFTVLYLIQEQRWAFQQMKDEQKQGKECKPCTPMRAPEYKDDCGQGYSCSF